jgi:flavin reductase (DIM6/NTAB) family NADH-FMN oxidoreductase RutF
MSSDRRPVTADEFRQACGRFATGVAVATALDAQSAPHGLTVSSFTSVSLDPPLILICVGHAVTCIDVFRTAKYFGVNVLEKGQREISEKFARKGEDRFTGTPWGPGETGVPMIPGAIAQMELEVFQRIPSGDHDIFVGRMVRAVVADGDPLLYFAGQYREIG